MGVRRHICYVLLWDVTWRSAAKTALVAPLLRAGKAAMWRFQPLCRARWSRGLGVGEQAGVVQDGQTLFRGLSGEAWPLRGWGRRQEAEKLFQCFNYRSQNVIGRFIDLIGLFIWYDVAMKKGISERI